ISTAGRCIAWSTSSGILVGPGTARNSRPARTVMSASHLAVAAAHGAPCWCGIVLPAPSLWKGTLGPLTPSESRANHSTNHGDATTDGSRLTECRHRLRGISLQLRISFLRARRQIFSRNGTMLYCRERDRVLFVATTARLSA